MKQGIHPQYVECTVTCSCGNTFKTHATVSEMKVELCNECHPFYTGQQKFVDTGGRVQRFADKFGGAAAAQLKKAEEAKAAKAAKAAEAEAARKAAAEAKAAEKAKRAAKFAEEGPGSSNHHKGACPLRGGRAGSIVFPDKTCQNKPVPFWQVGRVVVITWRSRSTV